MTYQTFFSTLPFLLLIAIMVIAKSERHKKLKYILAGLFIFIFSAQIFFPRQIFGKWNSITTLINKKITRVILSPAKPTWQVNLVSKDFYISNPYQIDTLINFLQHAEVFFANHDAQTWETNMVLVSNENDSFKIYVGRKQSMGTMFKTPTTQWRKDEIGIYLEKLTNFKFPLYSDTAIERN